MPSINFKDNTKRMRLEQKWGKIVDHLWFLASTVLNSLPCRLFLARTISAASVKTISELVQGKVEKFLAHTSAGRQGVFGFQWALKRPLYPGTEKVPAFLPLYTLLHPCPYFHIFTMIVLHLENNL